MNTARQKSECPGATGQDADQSTAAAILTPVSDSSNNEKRQATIKAELARRGFDVHALADDGFVVCRWNMSCHCQNLAALVAFARRVGVRP